MNYNQRKFMKELSDLMEKHNVRFDVVRSFGEIDGYCFNIGGKKTDVMNYSLTPSIIRSIVQKDLAKRAHNTYNELKQNAAEEPDELYSGYMKNKGE